MKILMPLSLVKVVSLSKKQNSRAARLTLSPGSNVLKLLWCFGLNKKVTAIMVTGHGMTESRYKGMVSPGLGWTFGL